MTRDTRPKALAEAILFDWLDGDQTETSVEVLTRVIRAERARCRRAVREAFPDWAWAKNEALAALRALDKKA